MDQVATSYVYIKLISVFEKNVMSYLMRQPGDALGVQGLQNP